MFLGVGAQDLTEQRDEMVVLVVCNQRIQTLYSFVFRSSAGSVYRSLMPLLFSVLSIEEPMLLESEADGEERPALVPSLFPLMPPTLYFSTANEKGPDT